MKIQQELMTNQFQEKIVFIITNSVDAHADLVEPYIASLNGKTVRINSDKLDIETELTYKLISGNKPSLSLRLHKELIELKGRSVWVRRPFSFKSPTSAKEQFSKQEISITMKNLISSFPKTVKIVDRVEALNAASQKVPQLKLAQKLGLQIPKSIITNSPEEARNFFLGCNKKVIVKPIDTGRALLKNDYLMIYTTELNDKMDFNIVKNCPTFFQEKIIKKSELRITIIGKKVFAVEFDSSKTSDGLIDWRKSDELDKIPHHVIKLPKVIETKLVKMLEYYNLNFGAIDMAITPDGKYVFFELNPAGQFLWLDRVTEGLHLGEEMAKFLLSD
jgi:hypothetical protein